MSNQSEKFEISEHNKKEIDHWLAKYPASQRRSAVVAALLLVQEQNGDWLSDAAMDAVAAYLKISKIEVYEVASFYEMYHLVPVGKHKISVCTNIACMLRGSSELVHYLENRLGITMGKTTSDGLFTLAEAECLAACAAAPVCQINDKHYHENLTPEKMAELIDRLAREHTTHAD